VSKKFNMSIYNIHCKDHTVVHINTLLALNFIWTCKYNFYIAAVGDEETDFKIP